jgi:diguanylate cyclase (GGDEF)-like protein/PAS domain S-box-containing protein
MIDRRADSPAIRMGGKSGLADRVIFGGGRSGEPLTTSDSDTGFAVAELDRQLGEAHERERVLRERLADLDAMARLGIAAEHVGDSIKFTDDGAIQYVNPAYEALTGYTRAEVIGRTPAQVLRSDAHPPGFYEHIWDVTAAGAVWKGLMKSRRKDGSEFTAHCTLSPVFGTDGGLVAFMRLRRDVTQEELEKEQLRAAVSRFSLASAGANDGMWAWDPNGEEVLLSPRWRHQIGLDTYEFQGPSEEWFDRLHPEDRPRFEHEVQQHLDGHTDCIESEYRIRHRDGSWRWMLCRGVAERDAEGRPIRVAGSQGDITTRKTAELQLRHQVLHDTLTGLPNRALFQDRLQQALLRCEREPERSVAVMFVDLDRFKKVNDSLGHAAGDQLLREVGRRLQRGVRGADSVARIGGDEFTVLLDGVRDESEVEDVAGRILEAVRAPIVIDGVELIVSASIGVATSSKDPRDAEDLLRDADTAMYRAKADGRGRSVAFEPAMRSEVVGRVRIERALRQALARHELLLHYQPIVELPSLRLTGFEALVRWNRPGEGIVGPDSFLPAAHEVGLMDELESWVLQHVCDQIAAWRVMGSMDEDGWVAVNISPDLLINPALLDRVEQALGRHGLPARVLKLEITESSFLKDDQAAARALLDLRALGVRVALDDFGTGYSSLSHVQRFSVDMLKIDRSFISGLLSSSSSDAIVRAILGLASGLGLEVTAEGVETQGQLDRLVELGCDAAQGYLLGRPGGPDTVDGG